MLTQSEIAQIANACAIIVVKKLQEKEMFPEMVNTSDAAKILGITPDRLRHKADQYPHVKTGEGKQARLLFLRKELLK